MSTDYFIHKASEFNPTVRNISFKPVGFGTGGFGTALITHNNSSINLQTHALTTPFGYSDGSGGKWGRQKPFIQFNLYPDREEDQQMLEGLNKLSELIIQTAFDRRVEWNLFPSQRKAQAATIEDVREKFNPIVRPGRGDYPPTFKVSFGMKKDGTVFTPCHDEANELIIASEATIPRFSRCACDLQAKTIWISGDGKFGIKFTLQKIQVLPPAPREGTSSFVGSRSRNRGYADVDDDDSDDDGRPGGKRVVATTSSASTKSNTFQAKYDDGRPGGSTRTFIPCDVPASHRPRKSTTKSGAMSSGKCLMKDDSDSD